MKMYKGNLNGVQNSNLVQLINIGKECGSIKDVWNKNIKYLNPNEELPLCFRNTKNIIGKYAYIHKSVLGTECDIEGSIINSVVFNNVKIGKDITVKNSIILEGTVLEGKAIYENCIIKKNVCIDVKAKPQDYKAKGINNDTLKIG